MVFRRLRKRGRDRARSSERRRLGKAFQKDGPTTAKLLRWAVASLTLGTTRSPCSAERRDLRPGKDDTGTQSSLRQTGAWPVRPLRMSIKILKAIRLCIGSQCSSARMNSYMPKLRNPTNLSSSSIQILGDPQRRLRVDVVNGWPLCPQSGSAFPNLVRGPLGVREALTGSAGIYCCLAEFREKCV